MFDKEGRIGKCPKQKHAPVVVMYQRTDNERIYYQMNGI